MSSSLLPPLYSTSHSPLAFSSPCPGDLFKVLRDPQLTKLCPQIDLQTNNGFTICISLVFPNNLGRGTEQGLLAPFADEKPEILVR